MSALAGLCALRHFDLYFFCVQQVFARHAEASRGDLLDRAAAVDAVCADGQALALFAALARV